MFPVETSFSQPTKQEARAISEFYKDYVLAIHKKTYKLSIFWTCLACAFCLGSIFLSDEKDLSFIILANVSVGFAMCSILYTVFLSGREYFPFVRGRFQIMYGKVSSVKWDDASDRRCYIRFASSSGRHTFDRWFCVPVYGVATGSPVILIRSPMRCGLTTYHRTYACLTPSMLRPYSSHGKSTKGIR